MKPIPKPAKIAAMSQEDSSFFDLIFNALSVKVLPLIIQVGKLTYCGEVRANQPLGTYLPEARPTATIKVATIDPTPMMIVGKATNGGGANKTHSVNPSVIIPSKTETHPIARPCILYHFTLRYRSILVVLPLPINLSEKVEKSWPFILIYSLEIYSPTIGTYSAGLPR